MSVWDKGVKAKDNSASSWDTGIPVVTPTVEPTSTPTAPAPEIWNKAKSISTKPSWSDAAPITAPKSALQKVYEGILGEGTITGNFDHMTVIGKTLDLMGRPGYAVKSAINQSQLETNQYLLDNGIPEEELTNYLNPKRQQLLLKFKPQLEKRFKAMWAGFSGQERITANQIWGNVGVRGIPFLGFATEIALDPMMIMGGAGYKALSAGTKLVAGKTVMPVAKFAGTQLSKIPGVTQASNFAIDKTGQVAEGIKNLFVTKSKIPELANMIDKYISKRQWLGGKSIDFGVQTREAIQKVSKDTGRKIDDVEKMIVNIIERPKKYKSLATKGELEIAKSVQNRLANTFTHMTDAGVPISALGTARKARIEELKGKLVGAVGEKKTQLLEGIVEHKQALEDEIRQFKLGIQPLEVEVAHYSKNPNILVWKVNRKTVYNDLGTDFGTEGAALARQRDIGRGGEGKIYYTKISPRRPIDATKIPMGEQLQYWDDPKQVVEFLQKTGAIGPDEYERLLNAIPDPTNPMFKKVKVTPEKIRRKLIAQTGDESGVIEHVRIFKGKDQILTIDDIDTLAKLPQTGEAIIGDLKISWNPKAKKYNIYKMEVTQSSVEAGSFVADRFYNAQQDWYVNTRRLLVEKGYDSIKYFSLEDTVNPTYKILTGRIVGGANKGDIARQAHLLNQITAKEAETVDLINNAKDIYHMPVSERRILSTAKKLGVGKTEAKEIAQLQRAREMGYFPRFTTKEAEAFLKNAAKSQGMGAKVWNSKIKNALRRKTSDFTLDEWNTFVNDNGLASLGGNKIGEYFMRDPAYASALYEMRAAKAITSAEFIQEASMTFGKSAKTAPAGWQYMPEAMQKLYPVAKDMKFDPEVLKEIGRVTEHYINPAKAGPALQVIDNIQNSWRKWTLAPFPKYHIRNMVGNLWNNYLAGVSPENYPRAQALQLYRKYKGSGKVQEKIAMAELSQFKISPDVADTIIAAAEEHGVLGRGWFGADVEMGIKQQMEKGGLIQRGMAVGATIENNARLAHFLDKLDKGADSMEAALSVKKYLFDYGDLTSFEKEVMRRLFPFYTWTRKNIPLQLEELWNNPQKFAPVAIPFRMRNEEDMIKLKYARPDLYERLPIELRRTMDTVTYVPVEGLIPAGDLAKIVRPQELLFELLTPYLRTPIELQMNRSMYFESEIQKYPGETQEVWRLDMPVKLKYALTTVLPQARLISEIDKIVKKQVKKEELTVLEQAFSQSLSSIYKVDLKELRNRALHTMQSKVDELRKGMGTARRQEREDEEERIKKTYTQIKDEIQRIKGN